MQAAIMNKTPHTLLERIQWILDKRQWTHQQLSERSGWHRTQISAYMDRLRRNPGFAKKMSIETYEKLAKGGQVSLLWLEHGIGEPEARIVPLSLLEARYPNLELAIQKSGKRWQEETISAARSMNIDSDPSPQEWESALDNIEAALRPLFE